MKSDRQKFIEKARDKKRDKSKKHKVRESDPLASRVVSNTDLRKEGGYR